MAQYVFLALAFMSLLIAANKDGKTTMETVSFLRIFLNIAVEIGLLYWGGFFNNM